MSSAPLLDDLEDQLRKGFLKYTRRAFALLPHMAAPHILDIGCGVGIPSLELARISGGTVIGQDTDEAALSRLETSAAEAGLEGRVAAKVCSMDQMDLQEEQFDLIWTEGSIQFIGFRNGLMQWRRLLKPGGFLVIHGETKDLRTKLELVARCGYDLIGHLDLPEKAWWNEYYKVLEGRLAELYERYAADPDAIRALDAKSDEVRMVKRDPLAFASMFLILQKT